MGRPEDYEDDHDDRDDRRPTRRRGFRCAFCDSDAPPLVRTQVSAGGWVTLVVLVLFCLPLFWIGLLMKEEYRVCRDCGTKLN